MKMLIRKRLRNVKRLKSNGFTMLEMLFSFSIFCLIATFLPLFFHLILNNHPIDARIQKMEWELFISQLKKEIQCSDMAEVMNGELMLMQEGDIITIQKYGTQLRRQVNRAGHETVLQNVNEVVFEKRDGKVVIEVKDKYGNTHLATIYPFIVWENNG